MREVVCLTGVLGPTEPLVRPPLLDLGGVPPGLALSFFTGVTLITSTSLSSSSELSLSDVRNSGDNRAGFLRPNFGVEFPDFFSLVRGVLFAVRGEALDLELDCLLDAGLLRSTFGEALAVVVATGAAGVTLGEGLEGAKSSFFGAGSLLWFCLDELLRGLPPGDLPTLLRLLAVLLTLLLLGDRPGALGGVFSWLRPLLRGGVLLSLLLPLPMLMVIRRPLSPPTFTLLFEFSASFWIMSPIRGSGMLS